MKRPTEIQARNYKEKDRHRSRERRPQGSREVGSQEEAGERHQLQNYLWRGGFSLLARGGAGRRLGRRSNFRNWMFHLPLGLGAVPCSVVACPRPPHMSLPSCSGS